MRFPIAVDARVGMNASLLLFSHGIRCFLASVVADVTAHVRVN